MVTAQPLGFLLGLRTHRNKLGSSQSRQGGVVKENNLKLSQLIIKQVEGCTTRLLAFKSPPHEASHLIHSAYFQKLNSEQSTRYIVALIIKFLHCY